MILREHVRPRAAVPEVPIAALLVLIHKRRGHLSVRQRIEGAAVLLRTRMNGRGLEEKGWRVVATVLALTLAMALGTALGHVAGSARVRTERSGGDGKRSSEALGRRRLLMPRIEGDRVARHEAAHDIARVPQRREARARAPAEAR